MAAIAAHLAYFFIFFFLLLCQRRMTIAAHIRFRFSQLGPGADRHTSTHTHTEKRPHQFGRVHIYPNHTHTHTHRHTMEWGSLFMCLLLLTFFYYFSRRLVTRPASPRYAMPCHAHYRPPPAPASAVHFCRNLAKSVV